MTVVLAILLAAAICLLAWQVRAGEAARRQLSRSAQDLRQVGQITSTIVGADWPRSMQNLVQALVHTGTCQHVVLFAFVDNGAPEVRAEAHAPGEPLWDASSEEGLRQALDGHKIVVDQAAVFCPVMDEREVVGVLAVRGALPDSAVLPVAARLAALGLTGMRLLQKQTILSNTDGLTGLANHRYFQQTLSVALAQAYLEGEGLSVILLDIDHFKKVNDTYGHLFGDLVLRELAYLVRRELPPDAMPARYGGEELVVIVRGSDAPRAAEIAEQVRAAIEAHQILDFTSGARLSVTVSLGVAFYELGQGKSRLMARADEALYTSKHEGRNRVTVAAPENSTSHLFPS